MGDIRRFPGKAEAACRHIEGIEILAWPELRRICLDVRLGAGDDFAIRCQLRNKFAGFSWIEITRDHDVRAIRRVAGAVVGGEIAIGNFIEEMTVADNRMAAGIYGERSRKKQADRGIVGIVESHVDLAADYVLFRLEF